MKVKDFIDKHPEFLQSDILYRAKCKETGKFVYGYYYKDLNNQKTYIIDGTIKSIRYKDNVSHLIEVIPETVGQFTRKFDEKNNRMVFEGDLYEIDGIIYTVKFRSYGFKLTEESNYKDLELEYASISYAKFIGNIFKKDWVIKWIN